MHGSVNLATSPFPPPVLRPTSPPVRPRAGALSSALAALLLVGCVASPQPVPLPLAPDPAGAIPAAPAAPEEAWRADVGNGLEYGITVRGAALFAATTNRVVVAHATADGRRFWGRRYGSPLVGSPVQEGERLYFGTGYRDRKVHALDAGLGRAAWERRLGEVRTAPALHRDTLYVSTEDGTVHALDAADGRVLWQRPLPDKAIAPPVIHGGDLLVATYADTLYAVLRATGDVRLRLPLSGTPSAPPLLSGDTLFLPLHPHTLAAVHLPVEPERPAALLWSAALGGPVLAAPVRAAGGALFVLDRGARLWRVEPDGTATLVRELGGAATGSLAAAAQGAVVGRLDGALVLVAHDGTVLWRRELEDAIVSPAVVRTDGLYVPLLHGKVVKFR